jgi:hypothetical protein
MRIETEMLSVTKTETASEIRTGTQIISGKLTMLLVRMANIFTPITTAKRAAFATDSFQTCWALGWSGDFT